MIRRSVMAPAMTRSHGLRLTAARCFASPPTAAPPVVVFDRNAKRLQRDRAVLHSHGTGRPHEQLRDEIAWQLADRVHDIARSFPRALDLGCGRGHLGKVLDQETVGQLVQCDLSGEMLRAFDASARDRPLRVQCDEEMLPFADNMFDLVVSNLSFHWVNDIPGALSEVRRVLTNDGAFVATMFGGDTLFELRGALQLAEQERLGGFGLHMSPLIKVGDVGGLLADAGFSLLTVDLDEVTVNFPSMFELLEDLRAMGEGNAAAGRAAGSLSRDVLHAAAAIYREVYGHADGTVPATFQVVHMVGWKPDKSQPMPKARGTATRSLKDIATLVDHKKP